MCEKSILREPNIFLGHSILYSNAKFQSNTFLLSVKKHRKCIYVHIHQFLQILAFITLIGLITHLMWYSINVRRKIIKQEFWNKIIRNLIRQIIHHQRLNAHMVCSRRRLLRIIYWASVYFELSQPFI